MQTLTRLPASNSSVFRQSEAPPKAKWGISGLAVYIGLPGIPAGRLGWKETPPKAALFPSVYLEDICSVELIMNVGEKVRRGKGEVQKRMLSV